MAQSRSTLCKWRYRCALNTALALGYLRPRGPHRGLTAGTARRGRIDCDVTAPLAELQSSMEASVSYLSTLSGEARIPSTWNLKFEIYYVVHMLPKCDTILILPSL